MENEKDVNFIALEFNENQKRFRTFAKSKAFDLIAVGLIITISLLSLGAIELRELTWKSIINIILETVPFYLGAISLALNYYKKGVFAGKSTQSYVDTIKSYSTQVNDLSGEQLDYLNDFCYEYNNKALQIRQENLLRPLAISYTRFNKGTEDVEPLKITSQEDLLKTYDKDIVEEIQKAKTLTVKGISPSILLGNHYTDDITDLGPNERELLKSRTKQYAQMYMMSVFVMSLMAVKNVMEWGWMGFILVAFKVIYILCRSYMKYFEGFEDMTERVTTHISRKVDVLKQYSYWFSKMPLVEKDSNIA